MIHQDRGRADPLEEKHNEQLRHTLHTHRLRMRPHQLLPRMDRQHQRNMALHVLPRRTNRPTNASRPSTGQRLPTRGHQPNHHGQTESQHMTTTSTGRGRSTAAYRNWVKQVLAKCEPTCIRCGYPVDMTLPRTHPQGASADHEPPLALSLIHI